MCNQIQIKVCFLLIQFNPRHQPKFSIRINPILEIDPNQIFNQNQFESFGLRINSVCFGFILIDASE